MGATQPDKSEGSDPLTEAYEMYASRLFGYLTTVVRHRQAAEDILQEIFCRMAARGAFFRVADPERYLFRAAHNEAMRWLRRSGRGPVEAPFVESLAAEADEIPLDPSPDAIARALSLLPPKQAEVVHLKIHEELTFAEVGRLLGCSTNTAASRYRYACEKLRRTLGGPADD